MVKFTGFNEQPGPAQEASSVIPDPAHLSGRLSEHSYLGKQVFKLIRGLAVNLGYRVLRDDGKICEKPGRYVVCGWSSTRQRTLRNGKTSDLGSSHLLRLSTNMDMDYRKLFNECMGKTELNNSTLGVLRDQKSYSQFCIKTEVFQILSVDICLIKSHLDHVRNLHGISVAILW